MIKQIANEEYLLDKARLPETRNVKPLVVDRTVLYLVNRNMIKREHFVREESGAVLLTETGKRIFIKALYDKLDTVITEKDKKLNYRQLIRAEVYKLVLCFKSDKPYNSFRQVR